MGQAPVIYSQSLTDASVRQLRLALVNRGYLEAEVTADTMMMPAEKKIKVAYKINTGEPRRIAIIRHEIPDSAVRKLILADSAQFSIHPGDRFDRDNLDSERALITQRLREHGYYSFNKEYITFYADTSEFNKDVDLTPYSPCSQKLSQQTTASRQHDKSQYILYKQGIFRHKQFRLQLIIRYRRRHCCL